MVIEAVGTDDHIYWWYGPKKWTCDQIYRIVENPRRKHSEKLSNNEWEESSKKKVHWVFIDPIIWKLPSLLQGHVQTNEYKLICV